MLKKYIPQIMEKYRKSIPLTMVTCYDYKTSSIIDSVDIDMILVGDSVSMVNMGNSNTVPITMDEMIHYCKSVTKKPIRPFVIGDMPFGSYEYCEKEAVKNAIRFLKEGNVDAVKLEGNKSSIIHKIVDSGISVMGHIGLTPQHVSKIGGFRSQGKNVKDAKKLIQDAISLEKAGCFSIVIECVPDSVSDVITKNLNIPTIGIGSGSKTSGQVLVINDMIGMSDNVPTFCKKYANVGYTIKEALEKYKKDVIDRKFPSKKFSPYKISKNDLDILKKKIK